MWQGFCFIWGLKPESEGLKNWKLPLIWLGLLSMFIGVIYAGIYAYVQKCIYMYYILEYLCISH